MSGQFYKQTENWRAQIGGNFEGCEELSDYVLGQQTVLIEYRKERFQKPVDKWYN